MIMFNFDSLLICANLAFSSYGEVSELNLS